MAKNVHNVAVDILRPFFLEILIKSLKYVSVDLIDDKSTLVEVIA